MDDYEDSYIEEAPEAAHDAPERQEAPADTNYEADARKQGWKPKEEYDGPAEKWRPADEFVKRGNEDPRILRSRVDKLDKLYEAAKKEREADRAALQRDFDQRIERQNRMTEYALRSQRESYEGQIESAKRTAAAEGDAQRYDELTQHQTAVKKQWAAEDKEVAPVAAQPKTNGAAPPPPPEVTNWIARNAWYNKDQALTDEAAAYEDYLAKAKPGLSLDERLEETRKHVVAQFPHKFGKKAGMNGSSEPRKGGSPVEGAQRGAGASSDDSGFGKLPAEARAQFKAFVKEKLFKDDAEGRANYAKYYDNPNADKVNG